MSRGGVLAGFTIPRGGGQTPFCPGGGEFAHQKNFPGRWSGLELTDTLDWSLFSWTLISGS